MRSVASTAEATMTVAVSHWPPRKMTTKDGKVSGIDVDIMRELARRMQMRVIFYTCTWIRCQTMVRLGSADFITSASRTPDREPYFHFIEPSYAPNGGYAFYVRADSGVRIEKYDDLHKHIIGTTMGAKYMEVGADPKIYWVRTTGTRELLRKLKSKELDVIIDSAELMDYFLKNNPDEKLAIAKSPYVYITPQRAYMALSRRSELVHLIPRFSTVLQQMLDEGKIEAILENYR